MIYHLKYFHEDWNNISKEANWIARKYAPTEYMYYNMSYTINEILQNCTKYYYSINDHIVMRIHTNPLYILVKSYANELNTKKITTIINSINNVQNNKKDIHKLFSKTMGYNISLHKSEIGLISICHKFGNVIKYKNKKIGKNHYQLILKIELIDNT